jgi:pimeloyl-ACP methyl ester carboxylesterase
MIVQAPDLVRGVDTAVEHPADGVERGGPRVAQQPADRSRRPLVPLLVIHGKRDDQVPPEIGITIYMRATAKKSLLLVDGATHSDAATVDTDAYQAAVERLMPGLDRAFASFRPRAAPSRAG